jgi:hypothetical protein
VKNGEGEMIKKVKAGYKVTSSKGKNLGGPYESKEAAKKRLRQVEFFKHSNKKDLHGSSSRAPG